MKVVPVILSGGAGARLWPLSRDTFPKPFIRLPEGDTLIRRAYRRALGLGNAGHVVTVTNRELAFLTIDEYEAVAAGGVRNSYLLEPFGRDTAAAIALSVLHVAETEGAEAIVLALPADHLITDDAALSAAAAQAVKLAQAGRIVTFGIQPSHPETAFGYIEAEGNEVLRFVEKPDAATAAAYLESGRFFWNSGMFCFSAGTMIEVMEKLCPEILAGARAALDNAKVLKGEGRVSVEIDADSFAATPAISIDYAVMEKATNIAIVPCDCGWSDVGSWSAMSGLVEADAHGNRVIGDTALENAQNCYVQSQDRLVGLVGVRDLVVIDTPDALLVAHRDSTQDVKTLYNRLKREGHEAVSLHRTVHRPWGTYTILGEGGRFKIKRIEVKPGASLSLQAHHHRSEHWIVVSGTAQVVNGDKDILLTTDQSTYIPCGNRHRLSNPGKIRLVMIEVQSGDYLGEDDILRFDDVYGRS